MPKQPNRKPSIKRSVILDEDENDAINEIASDERRSFNSVVRQAIKEFLDRRFKRQEEEAA